MKRETINFVLGIILGLLLSSLITYISQNPSELAAYYSKLTNTDFMEANTNPTSSTSFSSSLKDEIPSSETGSFRESKTNPGQSLIKARPNDPRLSQLKRKPFDALPASFPPQAENQVIGQPQSTAARKSVGSGNSSSEGHQSKRAKCMSVFGERAYLKENQKKLPPLLYTFPGSGNTWCRLLIEYATGIYTGSVYNDDSLLNALPGEFTCNWQVSVVKAHPHTHRASELLSGHYNSDNNKCKRGNIQRFERAVLLIRDPFDSIWSEFQRRVTQSHVKGILRESFNWNRWQANAANLAHAYLDMWKLDHDLIERQLSKDGFLYVKYEDLKSKERRVKALESIVSFLNLPNNAETQNRLQKRLECAFVLAENRQAHRTIDENMYMTKDIAYLEEIVCRMWNLFGDYAKRFGYGPWKGMDCAGYPKMPRINVGPHGDYDHRWVQPGAKLIDFRGKLFRNGTMLGGATAAEVSRPKVKRGPPAEKKDGAFADIERQVLKKQQLVQKRKAAKRPPNTPQLPATLRH